MTPDQITEVLATAVRAPSVHNTQPWLFEVDGDTIHVRADRRRQLALEDPRGRELLLSCGAAAVHAQLAVRGLGLRCDLRWSPTPGDPDHVATLTVSRPLPVTPEESRLLDAVALRHTDRSAFAPTPVLPALIAALSTAAEQDGAHLVAEQQPDRVLALDVMVSHADRVLRADPALRKEQVGWVRPGSHPVEGVPSGALPDHGHSRGSSLTLRDFDPEDVPPAASLEPPAAEHPLLVVLSTDGDGPEDWARSGGALARVLLTATAAGLVANPQTQVLEVPGLRFRLVAELGLVGYPQMLLRVGYPTGPGSPPTGRRPVADVLAPPTSGAKAPAGVAAPDTLEQSDNAGAALQELATDDCLVLLATAQIGRLGVIADDYPLIIPVSSNLDNGGIVLRSRSGTKLAAAQHANVTLEVDQIDPLTQTGWSVLVRGLAEEITDRHDRELVERTHAVATTPRASGDHDHWVRLIPHRITGRRLLAPALPLAFESAGYLTPQPGARAGQLS